MKQPDNCHKFGCYECVIEENIGEHGLSCIDEMS